MLRILHVERTLVKLRHRVVSLKKRHLLVHLADDKPRQRHTRDATHQLHRAAVVHVPVAHVELLTLALVVVQQVDCERAPLRRAGVEIAFLHVQVPRANRL